MQHVDRLMEWFGSVSFHQQLPQQQSSTAMMHGLWRSLRFQPQQQQRNYFCCYSCVRPLVYFHTLDYPKNFHKNYQFLFKYKLFWDFNAHASSVLSPFPLTHHHSRSLTLRHHIFTTKFHISHHTPLWTCSPLLSTTTTYYHFTPPYWIWIDEWSRNVT